LSFRFVARFFFFFFLFLTDFIILSPFSVLCFPELKHFQNHAVLSAKGKIPVPACIFSSTSHANAPPPPPTQGASYGPRPSNMAD